MEWTEQKKFVSKRSRSVLTILNSIKLLIILYQVAFLSHTADWNLFKKYYAWHNYERNNYMKFIAFEGVISIYFN